MINVRLSTVLIFILSILGCSKASPEIPNNTIIGSRCEKPKQFILHAGNQSGYKNEVDIKVWVDGTLVVDEDFQVLDHHHWKAYKIKLCNGSHDLEAESETGGARMRFKFEVKNEVDYGLLNFWNNPKEGVPGSFTFETGKGSFHPA